MAEKKTAKKSDSSDKTFKASDIKFQSKYPNSRSKYKHEKFSKKEILLGLVLVLFLAIPVVFFAFSGEEDTNPVEEVANIEQCGSRDTVFKLQEQDIARLDKIVSEIRVDERHKDDPNCIYLITDFYLLTGNTQLAIEYFEYLKQIDRSELSSALAINAKSDEEIKESINFLVMRDEQIQNSLQFSSDQYGELNIPEGEN